MEFYATFVIEVVLEDRFPKEYYLLLKFDPTNVQHCIVTVVMRLLS